jgi:tetratricopeptide (TPR) repeat protein
MSKKMIITMTTLLATLFAASLMGGAYLVNAQEVDENQVAAENLLSMLTTSEAEVTSLFETIVGDGGTVPEDAAETLIEAQELHAEAQGLYDEGNYVESVEIATEALNKYGEALTEATPEEAEEPIVMTTEEQGETEEIEKMVGLKANIDKLRARNETLIGIADDLDASDADTTDARELLVLAGRELKNIETLLMGDYEESEIVLGKAVRLIGQATGMLKGKGNSMKEAKLEQFTQQAMHRMGQLEKKMNKILAKMGSSDESVLMVQAQFSEIFTGLEGIEDKDDLKEAVKQLKQIIKETKQVGKGNEETEDIFDDEMMESINNQMKMESKIVYYKAQVTELEANGEMTDEVQALIDAVEELLEEAESALANGDKDGADELVESAEDLMEEMDGIFKGFGKGNGKGPKPGKGYLKEGKPDNGKANNKGKKSEEPDEPEDPETP